MATWLLLLVSIPFTFSDSYMTELRDDATVPSHCKETELDFFQIPPEVFYVGRKGALNMGFTFEYPVERKDATTLWYYFKDLVNGHDNKSLKKKIFAKPDTKRDYAIIMQNFEDQGFDFGSEGEVLEALAIEQLYQEFPENQYYITGGIQYHEEYSPMTIGEVDVLIGNRQTCEVVAIGEVKLGSKKSLSKARKQLQRLSHFLVDHDCPSLGKEYKPHAPSAQPRLPRSKDFMEVVAARKLKE